MALDIALLNRCDLRMHDNQALAAASRNKRVIALYIYDADRELGAASKWWLHHALKSFADGLKNNKITFCIAHGNTNTVIQELRANHEINSIHINYSYQPDRDTLALELKRQFPDLLQIHPGNLLQHPWQISNKSGSNFKVYTPFWKAVEGTTPNLELKHVTSQTHFTQINNFVHLTKIEELGLLPKRNWDAGFYQTWQVGEEQALAKLDHFLQKLIAGYKEQRNFLAQQATSRLSPHIAFGEISVRLIWNRCLQYREQYPELYEDITHFMKELAWRDFSYNLLHNFPSLAQSPWNNKFCAFAWETDYADNLECWQKGRTGYPVIDAAMRELWATGYMHNRARMITASFLTKDLFIPWQEGERWFRDTLVDYDPANNAASWQWVAGCGADAAPYFRIFNPVLQSEKFDPEGEYIKQWLPELRNLPNRLIHAPWKAGAMELDLYGVTLGDNYPLRIVDHDFAKRLAMQKYKNL
jgi:deoxyribodipyrimidine photo-lyase